MVCLWMPCVSQYRTGENTLWSERWNGIRQKTTSGFPLGFGRKIKICQAWSCATPILYIEVWEHCQGYFDNIIKMRGIRRWAGPWGVVMMIANRLIQYAAFDRPRLRSNCWFCNTVTCRVKYALSEVWFWKRVIGQIPKKKVVNKKHNVFIFPFLMCFFL